MDFAELYSAKWRPMPKAEFPDIPASPRSFKQSQSGPIDAPKKAAYRPPSGTSRSATPPPPPPPPRLAVPLNDWFYRDPQGNVHGPYDRSVMESWNSAGYFRADLPIRQGISVTRHFVELNQLFGDVAGAFKEGSTINWPWER